jgi:hypothetical protein
MGSIKSGLFLLLMVLTGFAKAQGLGDWFNQAGEQKRYYLQQIAAYQAFASVLKQGYGVVQHGLGGIRDINTAELDLHTAYYHSLHVASPAVMQDVWVNEILIWERLVVSQFSGVSFDGLLPDEQTYVVAVRTAVFKACDQDLTALQVLLSSGQLQMSDGERLKRLGLIHAAMLDKMEFTQSFVSSVRLLVLGRSRESNDVQTLKKLP